MLSCLLLGSVSLEAGTFVVNPSKRLQRLEGWGVSLCWWAGQAGKWSEAKIDSVVEWLASKDGLNYNVFRYNIPGGDDPLNRNCDLHHMEHGKGLRAEMEGFKRSPEADYDWTADAAQRRVMLLIKKKRPDAIFEAFSNTPPYFMTVSGCAAGNKEAGRDNLRKDQYEAFADYLIDCCLHYKEKYGIEFHSLEPFNEPNTDYWPCNGSQEGCHFDIQSMMDFIKVLSPKLKASGLKTHLSASDETSVMLSVKSLEAFRKAPSVLPSLRQWNTHTYSATPESRVQLRLLARQTGLPLWMSETGEFGGKGLNGNLKLSQRLMDDIKQMQPVVWCDWQALEDKNDQWCTIRGDYGGKSFRRIKNYYVRRQVTHFIRQGYTFLDAGDEHTLTAISPNGKTLVIVSQNNGESPVDYTADLAPFKRVGKTAKNWLTDQTSDCREQPPVTIDGKKFSYCLQPQSIRTFIIKVKEPFRPKKS